MQRLQNNTCLCPLLCTCQLSAINDTIVDYRVHLKVQTIKILMLQIPNLYPKQPVKVFLGSIWSGVKPVHTP